MKNIHDQIYALKIEKRLEQTRKDRDPSRPRNAEITIINQKIDELEKYLHALRSTSDDFRHYDRRAGQQQITAELAQLKRKVAKTEDAHKKNAKILLKCQIVRQNVLIKDSGESHKSNASVTENNFFREFEHKIVRTANNMKTQITNMKKTLAVLTETKNTIKTKQKLFLARTTNADQYAIDLDALLIQLAHDYLYASRSFETQWSITAERFHPFGKEDAPKIKPEFPTRLWNQRASATIKESGDNSIAEDFLHDIRCIFTRTPESGFGLDALADFMTMHLPIPNWSQDKLLQLPLFQPTWRSKRVSIFMEKMKAEYTDKRQQREKIPDFLDDAWTNLYEQIRTCQEKFEQTIQHYNHQQEVITKRQQAAMQQEANERRQAERSDPDPQCALSNDKDLKGPFSAITISRRESKKGNRRQ